MTKKTKDLSQPIDDVQLSQLVIEWVPHESIQPNKYNPNRMTPKDRALLRQSLLEDGWTQPIVTLYNGTIVDGEQRWTVSGMPLEPEAIQAIIDKMHAQQAEGAVISESILERLHTSKARLEAAIEAGEEGSIAAITGGLVPVTHVDFKDDAHRMISTIRHNRARGSHSIDAMGGIMDDLKQLGLDFDDFEVRLGMDYEEVDRLLESRDIATEMLEENPDWDFSPAQPITHITQVEDDAEKMAKVASGGISEEVHQLHKAYEVARAEHEQAVKAEVQERVEAEEAEAEQALTQPERDKIERQVRKAMPAPMPPKQRVVKKLVFFLTLPEYEATLEVLGDPPVEGFVQLIREERARRELPPIAEEADADGHAQAA